MRVTQLSGGVGGARLARGFDLLPNVELTVVVNVGDDLPYRGLHVSPDLDTVTYTLAGVEGPEGWGRADDTFIADEEMARLGASGDFRVGDLDLALKLLRTGAMADGISLSTFTRGICAHFGIRSEVLPATDEVLRTVVVTSEGLELDFREYFVTRGQKDQVARLEFVGADRATPAPGVMDSITSCDMLVIGPSNPPLSIWPILAIPAVEKAVREHPRVVAVSPFIGGRPVKGPADRVIEDLGLGTGTDGVISCYEGLIDTLFVDRSDEKDLEEINDMDVRVTDTLIRDPEKARQLASVILQP